MSFDSFQNNNNHKIFYEFPEHPIEKPQIPPISNTDRFSRLGFKIATAFLLAFITPFAEYLGTVGIQYLEHYRYHKFPLAYVEPVTEKTSPKEAEKPSQDSENLEIELASKPKNQTKKNRKSKTE